MRRLYLLALFATGFALAATGCGGRADTSTGRPAAAQSKLTDLRSVTQLQQAFDAASNRPRLVVLVSPT